MYITRTKEELLDLFDRYNDPLVPTFILQEYIPGRGRFHMDVQWLF